MAQETAVGNRLSYHLALVVNLMSEGSQTESSLDLSTKLALDRTRNSYERTMMSWIRTATSLITFGFSIYKFFQIETPATRIANRFFGPREFALILVSIGVFSLFLATIEYRQSIRGLPVEYRASRRSLAAVVAFLVTLLGIVALVAMVFRE